MQYARTLSPPEQSSATAALLPRLWVRTILRMPGPKPPGPRAATTGAAPHDTARNLRDGNRTATYTANDGTPILRLPRTTGQEPKQNSYASAAATSATTVPGLNLDSQRGHHSQNNRGANQGQSEKNSGAAKQPTRVRQDQYSICPDTGHVKKVKPTRPLHTSRINRKEGKTNNT